MDIPRFPGKLSAGQRPMQGNTMKPFALFALMLTIAASSVATAQHGMYIQGKGRLAKLDSEGAVTWEMPWGAIHDIHVLENGHILVPKGRDTVCEIDPATKEVVWTYDAGSSNGNEGNPVEVHAFQPLPGGNVMIAESGPARIIEVDREGRLLKTIPLTVDNPHPHRDTRLARKLNNGNYLVCHEGDGAVREYDGDSGDVIWEYELPLFGKAPKPGHGPEAFGNAVFSAVRLASGNTLIGGGNGHCVLEVSPAKEIVWALHQNDLPGITLAWVTTLEVLPNGHYVIGNCHAGPNQPQLIELDPATRDVVWTFEEWDTYGNDVSNTVLTGFEGVRR